MGKNKYLYTYKGPVIRFRNILDNKWSSETYAESPTKALSNITYKAKKAFKLTPDMKLTLDPKCLHKQETTTLDLPDPKTTIKRCTKCGARLTDGGYCPQCDDGADDLDEDIEKHDTLNPLLFDDDELKPEVKKAIENIADRFIDDLLEDGIKFKLKDIVLVGSNVSYNYTKDSDLDIHLIADSSELDCPDDLYPLLYSAYRSIFNKTYDITIKGIPVELYIEID